eukprot:289257-Chlamydomonas_euryale.AAC.1
MLASEPGSCVGGSREVPHEGPGIHHHQASRPVAVEAAAVAESTPSGRPLSQCACEASHGASETTYRCVDPRGVRRGVSPVVC